MDQGCRRELWASSRITREKEVKLKGKRGHQEAGPYIMTYLGEEGKELRHQPE
jgi:hypothetical protein